MTALVYIAISIVLILFQTVIKPAFPILSGCYNLLTPFIIYLALFRPVRETVPTVLALGFVMDNISGGPFGLYLTTYIWLFFLIHWLIGYLRMRSTLLLPVVIIVGVLIENILSLVVISLLTPASQFPEQAVRTVFQQVLWAAITGVFLMGLLDRFWKGLENWYGSRVGQTHGEEM